MSVCALSSFVPATVSAPCCVFTRISAATAKRKKKAGICCERFCSRPRKPDRLRCSRCHKRRFREAHPIEHAYDNLRTHARGRGKVFTLTLADFRAFCEQTSYHELSGRNPGALTVDRIDPRRGYEAGNIRVLTHAENSFRRDTFTEAEIVAARAASWVPSSGPVEF